MREDNFIVKLQDTLFSPALVEQIRLVKPERVLIQLPEGLISSNLMPLIRYLKKEDINVFVSGDACWGGCDLVLEEAFRLNCDLLIHYGHSPYPRAERQATDTSSRTTSKTIPVIWAEVQSSQAIQNVLSDVFEQLKTRFGSETTVGLTTTVQHIHKLDEMQKFLEEMGLGTYLEETTTKLRYPGQILGCTMIKDREDVSTYIYLGGGKFHGLSVALSTGKPVLHVDPFASTSEWLDQDVNRLFKKRYAVIETARNARQWGVILGLRSSQFNPKSAQMVQEWLETDKREVVPLTLRDITGERIMAFNFLDAFVVTACPRIPIDDSEQFIKPVLNIYELGVLLGKYEWSTYKFF